MLRLFGSNGLSENPSAKALHVLVGEMIDRPEYPGKADAEAHFPHKVDVPEPPGGFAILHDRMLEWCRQGIPADNWRYFPHQDPAIRSAQGVPLRFARFYFANGADAEAFRRTWLRP
jgi:hypothetical protein